MNKTTLYPTTKDGCQWYIIDADSKTLGRLASELLESYLVKIHRIIILVGTLEMA